MYKIRKITFQNHPVLGDLSLNFCDINGDAVDTVIFAGENGCGKTILLNELYKIASHTNTNNEFSADIVNVEFEHDAKIYTVKYYYKEIINTGKYLYANNAVFGSLEERAMNPFCGIFSDVKINFDSNKLITVTSSKLDSNSESRRSAQGYVREINQLLIDIQAADDAELANAIRENMETKGCDLHIQERMPRFTNAFNKMFDDLLFDRITNVDNHKEIFFDKNGTKIPIDDLSSGEKQIIYRGAFLLKDVNALKGAFVFIDEPEISLHPNWQKKIMDYYKGIFTDSNGIQTSQIFVVTHSPFIIHNENRRNDKVIVLARDENGKIIVKDSPEYYDCNSIKVIEEAFDIQDFSATQPTVYLEGRTDEKYFNKAVEVFGLNIPFKFKWIGYLKDNGQEEYTGKDNLNKAYLFLKAQNLSTKNICLKDCDTKQEHKEENNAIIMSIPQFENSKGILIGIENALVLDDIDLDKFYTERNENAGYGKPKIIPEFNKMECCEYICTLDKDKLKIVFNNLKEVIEDLIKIYKED